MNTTQSDADLKRQRNAVSARRSRLTTKALRDAVIQQADTIAQYQQRERNMLETLQDMSHTLLRIYKEAQTLKSNYEMLLSTVTKPGANIQATLSSQRSACEEL